MSQIQLKQINYDFTQLQQQQQVNYLYQLIQKMILCNYQNGLPINDPMVLQELQNALNNLQQIPTTQ